MRKLLIAVCAGVFLIVGTPFLIASEMDKGSALDKGSTMEMKVDESSESREEVTQKETNSSEMEEVVSAQAVIKGTKEGSEVSGTVDFVQTPVGVQVVANLSNVSSSGKHGFHIHSEGSCENGGKAAGGHFNPHNTEHGLLSQDGHGKAHTGDMGNIEIDENGDGKLVIFLPGLSLEEGDRNISGKAVILHEKEDDFGQPTGNAGSRIGCGVIVLNN